MRAGDVDSVAVKDLVAAKDSVALEDSVDGIKALLETNGKKGYTATRL